MKAVLGLALIGSLCLAGCATGSSGVMTSYASPMMYGGYDCTQLALEDEGLRSRVAELKGAVDRAATNDKVMVGVGVALFWPALFFIKGNGEEQAEYGQLKGEHEAIQRAFLLKGCASQSTSPRYTSATPVAFPAMPTAQPVNSQNFGDDTAYVGERRRF